MYKFNYKLKFSELIETEKMIKQFSSMASAFSESGKKYFDKLVKDFEKYNNYFVEPRKDKKIIDMSEFKKGTTRFFK